MQLPDHRGHRPKRAFTNAGVDCAAGHRSGCASWCCDVSLVVIAKEDLDDGLEPEPGFLDLLARDDLGRCRYLDVDGACSVWEKRPLECRVYSCEGREKPDMLKACASATAGRKITQKPCAHCGAEPQYVVRFVTKVRRVRCAACGGPFLLRPVRGRRPLLRPDPARRSDGTRLADLAETRDYLGDLDGALAGYEAAAQAEPGEIRHALGILRVAARRNDEARVDEAFSTACAIDESLAWLERGLVLDDRGAVDEARDALRRAETLGAESPWLDWALHRCALARGDAGTAVRRLELAAHRGHNDSRIIQDMIDLAKDGDSRVIASVLATGDRRAMTALGHGRPHLAGH
jgi:Fe-S-cluster containining protein